MGDFKSTNKNNQSNKNLFYNFFIIALVLNRILSMIANLEGQLALVNAFRISVFRLLSSNQGAN